MGDLGAAAADPERYQLFLAGWKLVGCPLSQLWAQYLGLKGNVDLFTLDAFLHGMVTLPATEQDIIANAINEQLVDLYEEKKIPYVYTVVANTPDRNLLAVFDELFGRPPLDYPDQAG